MNNFLNSIFSSNNFNLLGSISSIVGLVLTALVYISLRKIKNKYLFAIRIPDLLKKLSNHHSALSDCFNEYHDSKDLIIYELAKTEVVLKSIKNKSNGTIKNSIKRLLKKIQSYNYSTDNEEELRIIYLEILKIIEEIKDRQQDLKWEQ